jgi:hypothetical protein
MKNVKTNSIIKSRIKMKKGQLSEQKEGNPKPKPTTPK